VTVTNPSASPTRGQHPMGAARGFLVPGSPHESSPGTAPSTVTGCKQCWGRTKLHTRSNWVWLQSCKRPHIALEHLHIADRAKAKTPSNELQLSEHALPLAVSCLYAWVCTYTCMCVRICACARTHTHISFDPEHRTIASHSRIFFVPKPAMRTHIRTQGLPST